MKHRLLAGLLTFAFTIAIPLIAFASDDDEGDGIDARLKGYQAGTVALKDASGTALTWVLLIILAAICIGVLFMSSKRTHLD
jgi:hypothetical protein